MYPFCRFKATALFPSDTPELSLDRTKRVLDIAVKVPDRLLGRGNPGFGDAKKRGVRRANPRTGFTEVATVFHRLQRDPPVWPCVTVEVEQSVSSNEADRSFHIPL